MERHFDQELSELRDQLLLMASLVQENLRRAMRMLVERDSSMMDLVEREDDQIDELEMQIDEICIKMLAIRSPVASDLRLITMAMKISVDLERIGDQAVNIGRRAKELNAEPPLKPLVDIPRMANIAQDMIKDALDAFVFNKPDLARKIPPRDQEVDDLNRQLCRELTSFMLEDPATITRALNLMFVAKFLERIADHASNIGEEVVYLSEGKDIRHHAEESEAQKSLS
jgi:phosphate transport system protein